MWYEINVSQNGMHYFATHKRSLDTEKKAQDLYAKFSVVFPEELGYKIEITRWSLGGQKVTPL